MVICFNATQEAKRALDSLIETNQFKDTSEAISMALVNYEVIQLAVKENREVLHADDQRPNHHHHPRRTVADASRPERVGAPGPQVPQQIPSLFLLAEIRPNDEDLLSVEAVKTDYKTLSPKDWLFGQWNRFLPAKATSRALLNIMCEHHSGIPVNDAANKISYAACDLGDYLRMLDARYARRREDSVSAAFPSTKHAGGESRLRYGNQFVGTIKQGKLIGLPAALGFIAHDLA